MDSDILAKYFTFYGHHLASVLYLLSNLYIFKMICPGKSFIKKWNFYFQAVSVVGRGDPVYSASPVPGHYDARTLQMTGYHQPSHVAATGSLPPTSPQLSHTYSHTLGHTPGHHQAASYSQSLAQAHEMSLGAHNVYHLVRPDYLQTLPSGNTTSK